jgi:hypothetical protein
MRAPLSPSAPSPLACRTEKLRAMHESPRRPLRFWSLRRADNHGRPSIKGGVILTLCALFLTYMAVWMAIHPKPENIAGDIILDAALMAVAAWAGRHTVRRWR